LAINAAKTQTQRVELAESSDTGEEKQLDPTERRLERAREEGQFAQSRDLTTFLVLVLFAACLLGLGASLMKGMVTLVQQGLTFGSSQDWQDHLAEWASGPLVSALMWVAAIVIPLWLVSAIAPLAMVKFQPVWAFKLNPDRLDPFAGLGRIFSTQTLTEVAKNILKVIVVFGVGVVYVIGLVGPDQCLVSARFQSGPVQQHGPDPNWPFFVVTTSFGGCRGRRGHSVVQLFKANENEPRRDEARDEGE
jgi:flagellar biosynthesis protein FlhB